MCLFHSVSSSKDEHNSAACHMMAEKTLSEVNKVVGIGLHIWWVFREMSEATTAQNNCHPTLYDTLSITLILLLRLLLK